VPVVDVAVPMVKVPLTGGKAAAPEESVRVPNLLRVVLAAWPTGKTLFTVAVKPVSAEDIVKLTFEPVLV